MTGSSGFILGLELFSCRDKPQPEQNEPDDDNIQQVDFKTPFLEITSTGEIIIIAPVPEMGQGVRTSLPLLLAEELDLDLKNVTVKQGAADPGLGGMAAAGSDSVADYFQLMRKAGATVREMLRAAASQRWKEPSGMIIIANGKASLKNANKTISWHQILPELKGMAVPTEIELKDRETYPFRGNVKNPDLERIVTGKAGYGLDVRMENMKYACIARCPVYKGKYKDYDAENTLKMSGVSQIVEIPSFIPGGDNYAEVVGGIAVVADNTWSAMKGKEALSITWDFGENQDKDSGGISIDASGSSVILRESGSLEESEETSQKTVEGDYRLPFLAHVCMEPMNFTAHVTDEKALLVGPTQVPRFIQESVSGIFKIPRTKVTVIPTLVGGGFGRRLAIDYAIEAAIVSKKAGVPIQVVWSREDDIRHDFFRSISIHRLKAHLGTDKVHSWIHEIYTQPIGGGPIYEVQGAADIPLNVSNIRISWGALKTAVRIGSWRSVAHSYNSFVVNCWIDELAYTLKMDTLDLMIDLIGPGSGDITTSLPLRGWRGNVTVNLGRLKNVIDKVAQKANWGEKLPSGRGRGIAFSIYKNAYSASITEVNVTSSEVTILKIWSVLDCGEVVHHDGVIAQMEGAIMDGIATVFHNEITYHAGRVKQSNFQDLSWGRISHYPQADLEVIASKENPRGAGEPPYPSIAPSIANAIYAASGIRLRKLPAYHHGLKLGIRDL